MELHQRPPVFQTGTLLTELSENKYNCNKFKPIGPTGLEPIIHLYERSVLPVKLRVILWRVIGLEPITTMPQIVILPVKLHPTTYKSNLLYIIAMKHIYIYIIFLK